MQHGVFNSRDVAQTKGSGQVRGLGIRREAVLPPPGAGVADGALPRRDGAIP
jgi:hypothetical protein